VVKTKAATEMFGSPRVPNPKPEHPTMSNFTRLFRQVASPKTQRLSRTRLAVESLEHREVPAIFLTAGSLVVYGDGSNDTITININRNGTETTADDKVVANRISVTPSQLGNLIFTETKSFDLSKVQSIMANLHGGTNSFNNGTDFKCYVTGGNGPDTIITGGGPDTIYAVGGNDYVDGGAGNDTIWGGSGNDTMAGGLGIDNLNGGTEHDRMFGGTAYGSLAEADGINVIKGGSGNDTIYGAGATDYLTGETGEDWIDGGAGDDHLDGSSGNDTLKGNGGDDLMEGGGDDDTLYGDSGDDTLMGEAGNDTLFGGKHADYLHGGSGNDQLNGDSGKDVLIGAEGTDFMYGGTGVDRLVALDNNVDLVFGGTTINNKERDELWLDGVEAMTNQVVIAKAKAVDKRSVHVVSDYKNYFANGFNVSPGLEYGINDLADPTAQDQDGTPAKLDFAGKPLFSTLGPRNTDINQGEVGTCYFLSRLAAVAKTYPQHIRDMITEVGDGTFVVRFYNMDGEARFVRVDGDLYVFDNGTPVYQGLGAEDSVWAAIVEKAWTIGRHGIADYDDVSGGNSNTTVTDTALGLDFVKQAAASFSSGKAFALMMRAYLNSGKAVIMGGPASLSDDTQMIPSNQATGEHVYMVQSVTIGSNGQPTKVTLYDPHGNTREITNFAMLYYCASNLVAMWPV